MTPGRVAALLLAAWLLVLGIVLQPHSRPLPRILHATPLELHQGDLPTLTP